MKYEKESAMQKSLPKTAPVVQCPVCRQIMHTSESGMYYVCSICKFKIRKLFLEAEDFRLDGHAWNTGIPGKKLEYLNPGILANYLLFFF